MLGLLCRKWQLDLGAGPRGRGSFAIAWLSPLVSILGKGPFRSPKERPIFRMGGPEGGAE